jgi:hypothetical protein
MRPVILDVPIAQGAIVSTRGVDLQIDMLERRGDVHLLFNPSSQLGDSSAEGDSGLVVVPLTGTWGDLDCDWVAVGYDVTVVSV